MKYRVEIVKTGHVYVEATDEQSAMYIADYLSVDRINWHGDWYPTKCIEDNSRSDDEYVTEPDYD